MSARVKILDKNCLYCKQPMVKSDKETPTHFNLRRKYCGDTCRYSAQLEQNNTMQIPYVSEEQLAENIKKLKEELESVEQQWFSAKDVCKFLGIIKN